MASDHVSCMVMAVSKQADYLRSGLTILSSFTILGEFLPLQTFEGAGESPNMASCFFCEHVSQSMVDTPGVAVIIEHSGWVFAYDNIAVWCCADEICEAVYDIHEQKNWRVVCG